MYSGVPRICCGRVNGAVVDDSVKDFTNRANPKSVIFKTPRLSIRMFWGLMSR